MSSATVTEVPTEVFSHDGETLVCRAVDVTLLDPYQGAIPGELFVTDFKLAFHGVRHRVEVHLGLIERVEKMGGASSRGENTYGLEIYCRDVRSIKLAFRAEGHTRRTTFETLSRLAFPWSTGSDIFACKFRLPGVPCGESPGWSLYDFEREMQRLGVPGRGWRITRANENFKLCPTYAPVLAVPASLDDTQVAECAQFRSKARLPVLSWLHPRTGAAIARASQPKTGIAGKRSAADEAYLEAIRALGSGGSGSASDNKNAPLIIMDARPRRNAVANQAKGGGYEPKSNYPNAELYFLNIHNIHVMRDSLAKVRDLCYPATSDRDWLGLLDGSNWLRHLRAVMRGATRMVDALERGRSILVHCSDGWDRTAQLSSVTMLLLDPYYRTLEGFCVLVEKEWLDLGHKFGQRIGHGLKTYSDDQRSPIFVQFVDVVYQIVLQYPCAFEFNEHFMTTLLDHLYSALYGTFLYNNVRERQGASLREKTHSLWDFILQTRSEYLNPLYSADLHPGKLSIVPAMSRLQLWSGYYLRWNPHMRPHESVETRAKQLQDMCTQLEAEVARLTTAAAAAGTTDPTTGSGSGSAATEVEESDSVPPIVQETAETDAAGVAGTAGDESEVLSEDAVENRAQATPHAETGAEEEEDVGPVSSV